MKEKLSLVLIKNKLKFLLPNLKVSEILKKQQYIFHFNVSTLEQILAYAQASIELDQWIFLGASESERNYLGTERIKRLIDFEKEKGAKVLLNADHCKNLKSAQEAVLAGYDAITFDMSYLSFEENLKLTKEFVKWAKNHNENIFIEGELGYIRGHSDVLKEKIEIKKEDLTNPEEAKIYVEETNVDALAIAIGNLHGISLVSQPVLDFDRLKEIRNKVDVFLVLHGGSGIKKDDLKKALTEGINIVHINTDLRIVWRETLEKVLNENPEIYTPYELLPDVILSLKNKVKKIITFDN